MAKDKRSVVFFMITVLEHGGGLENYYITTASQLMKGGKFQTRVVTMSDKFTENIIKLLSVFYRRKIDIKLSYKLSLDDVKSRLKPSTYIKVPKISDARRELNQHSVVYSKNELLEAFMFKFFIGYKRVPPVVFGGHTPLRFVNASSFYAKLHNFLYCGFIYKFLASGVAGFHVLNDFEYDLYREMFPNKKVFKVNNPFDSVAYRKLAERQPTNNDGKINVLWVGRLTEQKGIGQLVKLISKVNKENPHAFHWNIVGDGEYENEISALVKRFDNITHSGHVDPMKMPEMYSRADVFLSTSKWEGYPYVLLEARSFGLPIVANDIPGVVDIVRNYPNGYLLKDEKQGEVEFSRFAKNPPMKKITDHDEFAPEMVYEKLLSNLMEITN